MTAMNRFMCALNKGSTAYQSFATITPAVFPHTVPPLISFFASSTTPSQRSPQKQRDTSETTDATTAPHPPSSDRQPTSKQVAPSPSPASSETVQLQAEAASRREASTAGSETNGFKAGSRDDVQGSEMSSGSILSSGSKREVNSGDCSSSDLQQRKTTPPSARGIGRSVHAKGSSGIGSHRMVARTEGRTAAAEVTSGAGASGGMKEQGNGSPATSKQSASKASSPAARLERKSSPAWLPHMNAVDADADADAATTGYTPGATEPQLAAATACSSAAVTEDSSEAGNRRKLSAALDACGLTSPLAAVSPAGLRAGDGGLAQQKKKGQQVGEETCTSATSSPAAAADVPSIGVTTTTTSSGSSSGAQRVPSSSRARSMELAPRGGIRGMQARRGVGGGGGGVKGRAVEKRLERLESGDGDGDGDGEREPHTPKGGKDAMDLFLEKLRMAEAAEAQGLVSAVHCIARGGN